MKVRAIFFIIFFLFPIITLAGERLGVLYGSIKLEEGVPNPGKVLINLQCGETNDFSLFSAISVEVPGTFECPYKILPEREKCSLIFFLGEKKVDRKISKEIYLFKKPRRYDFIIDKEGDEYVVKRR